MEHPNTKFMGPISAFWGLRFSVLFSWQQGLGDTVTDAAGANRGEAPERMIRRSPQAVFRPVCRRTVGVDYRQRPMTEDLAVSLLCQEAKDYWASSVVANFDK
jgi:hypothetical protein